MTDGMSLELQFDDAGQLVKLSYHDGMLGSDYRLTPIQQQRLQRVLLGHGDTEQLLFPPMLRLLYGNDPQLLVVEAAPRLHNMTVRNVGCPRCHERNVTKCFSAEHRVRVALPWTLYVLDRATGLLSAFVRPAPLAQLDDPVWLMPTPNIYDDGRVCLGFSDVPPDLQATGMQFVHQFIQQFWDNTFNNDLTSYWSSAVMQVLSARLRADPALAATVGDCAFRYWETYTPAEVLDVAFFPPERAQPLKRHLRDLLRQTGRELVHVLDASENSALPARFWPLLASL